MGCTYDMHRDMRYIKNVFGKCEGKVQLRRPRCSMENDFKMVENLDWIFVPQNRIQGRTVANPVLNMLHKRGGIY